MSVLFVLTSHDHFEAIGKPTGVWAEEFLAPYYLLVDAGIDVAIASPSASPQRNAR